MYKKINTTKTKIAKYIIVGGVAFVLDNFTFYLLFNMFNVALLIATTISLLVGFAISFLGNKILVFGSEAEEDAHRTHKQLIFYALLLVFNMIFSYLFIKIMSGIFGYPVIFKIFAAIIIVFWNFIIYKKIIFKKV